MKKTIATLIAGLFATAAFAQTPAPAVKAEVKTEALATQAAVKEDAKEAKADAKQAKADAKQAKTHARHAKEAVKKEAKAEVKTEHKASAKVDAKVDAQGSKDSATVAAAAQAK